VGTAVKINIIFREQFEYAKHVGKRGEHSYLFVIKYLENEK